MEILLWVGSIVGLVGWIWLVVTAFGESILWGLASLFIPFVALIFGFLHFEETKAPTIMCAIGAACGIARTFT